MRVDLLEQVHHDRAGVGLVPSAHDPARPPGSRAAVAVAVEQLRDAGRGTTRGRTSPATTSRPARCLRRRYAASASPEPPWRRPRRRPRSHHRATPRTWSIADATWSIRRRWMPARAAGRRLREPPLAVVEQPGLLDVADQSSALRVGDARAGHRLDDRKDLPREHEQRPSHRQVLDQGRTTYNALSRSATDMSATRAQAERYTVAGSVACRQSIPAVADSTRAARASDAR